MRRGEIWLVHLDPSHGNEATKTRPCVVVSADPSNRVVERLGRGVVTIVPLTSNVAHVYAFQAFIPANPAYGLTVDSKAQAEQVRALDQARFIRKIGMLSTEQIVAVDEALITHLALDQVLGD